MTTVRQPNDETVRGPDSRRGSRSPGVRSFLPQHATRDPAEDRLIEALRRVRTAAARADRLSFGTNVVLEPKDDLRFIVDAVVGYRGSLGVIEVDGSWHKGRWAADRSRDNLLEDNGVLRVYRIPIEHTEDPDDLDEEIRRFLRKLPRRW